MNLHDLLKPEADEYGLDEMEVYLEDDEDDFFFNKKKKKSRKKETSTEVDIIKEVKSINYGDVDVYTGLTYIGKDNCSKLYKQLKKTYDFFSHKYAEVDNTKEKIDYSSIIEIDNVIVKTHMYNTNNIMEPYYSTLEIQFVIEFKLHNNGLNFNKEIKVSGSQDFGGCSPEEFKDLIKIVKKYC